MRYLLILILLIGSRFESPAQIRLPALFTDGMVLQQNTEVQVWGNAGTNELVKVNTSWNRKSYRTKADKSGRWKLKFDTPSAGGPYQIDISGKNRIMLKDVLVGEVWVCSGQSNMDMPVKGYFNAPVLHANEILLHSPNKLIRLFKVARNASDHPLDSLKGSWQRADPASVSDFSAIGYLFGRNLQAFLDVPVGIIQATWGGSPIEAWMGSEAIENVSKKRKLKGGATSSAIHQVQSNLYNGMIAPMAGYGVAGVLWYQGEQNRHNYEDYRWLLPEMVQSWRSAWGIGEWPFFYVQIAPMIYPEKQRQLVPLLWEVQWELAKEIPKAGMALSIDAGDMHNIHPPKKELIANRLLALALQRQYEQAVPASAPYFRYASIEGSSLKIYFSDLQMGLISFGKKITGFEIAGSDRIFYPAEAEIKGAEVIVRSEKVIAPVAVRYCFKDWATGSLFGVNGFPVAPFRSDDW